jgi:hypothetical protein
MAERQTKTGKEVTIGQRKRFLGLVPLGKYTFVNPTSISRLDA